MEKHSLKLPLQKLKQRSLPQWDFRISYFIQAIEQPSPGNQTGPNSFDAKSRETPFRFSGEIDADHNTGSD